VQADFDPDGLKVLFVERSGGKAPYFIKNIRTTKDGLIVSLEEIDSIEKARALQKQPVFIDASMIEEEDIEWIGYEIIDEQYGSLGNITAASDNGTQLLVTVIFRQKEIILPLADELISSIDEDKRVIHYSSPEGLIDMYLT
jgi:16S rRNA processing protein RimM